MTIRTQNDLNRANIEMAFRLAHGWSPEQFERLCRVAVEQMRRDAEVDRESAMAAA